MGQVTVRVGGLQKVVNYTVQTPAPSTLLVGATLRGTGSGDGVSLPRPKWGIVRTYNIGDALTALRQSKGARVATSFGSMLGGPGWSSSASTVDTLRSQLTSLPDFPGLRVGDTHEFDNPNKYGADYGTYLTDAAKFKQVVASVNAGRTNPLTIFRCCMAFSFGQPSRKIDEFYQRDPQNYDEFGPDVYKIPDIATAVDKAVQYGKPLCVPEFGPLDNVAHNDPAILDEMQRGIAAWDGVATWVAWFDKKGAGADLDQYPNALDYWTRQNAR